MFVDTRYKNHGIAVQALEARYGIAGQVRVSAAQVRPVVKLLEL